MSTPFSHPHTFIVNTRARSAQVNANFLQTRNIFASHHHDPNIYSDAVPLTNSGIAENAQIKDTQLRSQITRSGLINESSIQQITQPGKIAASAIPGRIAPITRTYTAGDTWNKPPGLLYVVIEAQGAGGGGGGASGARGGGGGGGAYVKKFLDADDIGSSETITIGAGGIAGTSSSNGGAGGTTSFGSLVQANGGAGGGEDSNSSFGGAGGTASGGDLNISGGNGQQGNSGTTDSYIGWGGSSFFGDGFPGFGYGYGGRGGQSGNGAVGAAGIIVVTEYY